MQTYEAMFLLEPGMANDWSAAEAEIKRIIDRADGKLIGTRNWEERKLAYQIGQYKRGLYALCYFEAPPEKIAGLERDVQLSEKMIRVLVIRRDRMDPEAIQKALAAPPPPKTPARQTDEWSAMGVGRPARAPAAEPGRPAEAESAVAVEEVPDIDAIDEV